MLYATEGMHVASTVLYIDHALYLQWKDQQVYPLSQEQCIHLFGADDLVDA